MDVPLRGGVAPIVPHDKYRQAHWTRGHPKAVFDGRSCSWQRILPTVCIHVLPHVVVGLARCTCWMGATGYAPVHRTYRIGIDVGQNSVGCAAIEFDDDGFAVGSLALASFVHDGGGDPNAGQTKVSRLAAAGVARRTRRLFHRRRARLNKVEAVLSSAGFCVDPGFAHQTYAEWFARDRLSREFVSDVSARKYLVALAVMHIARHRGWRNSWQSFRVLSEQPSPSQNLQLTLDRASEILGSDAQVVTLGQAVAAVVEACGTDQTIRPRKKRSYVGRASVKDVATPDGPLMGEQVRQEDQLAELRLILRTQRVDDDTVEQICQTVFEVEKPHVPEGRIGRDELPGMEHLPRASRATLEFQEFRIRAFVGNLRLSEDQVETIVEGLWNWREAGPPRIADVAAMIGLKPGQLNRDSLDRASVNAPTDTTSAIVESSLKSRDPVRVWWDAANFAQRCEFVALICGEGDTDEIDDGLLTGLGAILESDDGAGERLDQLAAKFQSGRSAYSRASLGRILAEMRATNCDAWNALKQAFDLDDDWRPRSPKLSDPIEHPTVQRINTIVRRFVMGCVEKWGPPQDVVVEHVRSAFYGPGALQEYRLEVAGNQRRTETLKTELRDQGFANPSRADARRYQALQRQNCNCLYCGATIAMETSQMDHIVPDSLGGSNRRENLVAVCRTCNDDKGNLSFAEFVASGKRSQVTMEDTLARVDQWQPVNENRHQLARLRTLVKQRLQSAASDLGEMDERSLATTAYAATELRARIAGTLGLDLRDVHVYRGEINSEARRAGGVDDRLRLRDKPFKSRFDRRHHAIDAAVITTLTPMIATVLAERGEMRLAQRLEGREIETWRDYEGSTATARDEYTLWRQRMQSLSDILIREIEADRVPVVRQLRLNTRVGAIHSATVDPFVHKSLNDSWTADEVDRIVDPDLYMLMFNQLRRKNQRTGLVGFAPRLDADDKRFDAFRETGAPAPAVVALYKRGGAQLAVRGGCAAIGGSVHHARLYAWKNDTGFGFGWVRVFGGELAALGLERGDVLTCDLPQASASMRNTTRSLRQRIENGQAKQIGWLTQNDELEIDPYGPLAKSGKLGQLLNAMRESRWLLTGMREDGRASVAPALLAAEGLPDADPEGEAAGVLAQVLKDNRVALAVNVLFQDPRLIVIRRTALGKPRWRSDVLPVSWSPWKAAQAVFRE